MARIGATERFWTCVKIDGPSGCWLWQGGLDGKGYGKFSDRRRWGAHRWAYIALRGPIPDGLVLDHLCRVPRCVNPDHLEPVTHRTNTLRGVNHVAEHAVKMHCKRGHPFDEVNTYNRPSGGRECRTCTRDFHRRYRSVRPC